MFFGVFFFLIKVKTIKVRNTLITHTETVFCLLLTKGVILVSFGLDLEFLTLRGDHQN